MEDDMNDGKLLARFDKYQDFLGRQQSLLSLDLLAKPSEEERSSEWQITKKLRETLDEYQEQAYLLDPFLDSLITPVVDCLKSHVKTFVETKQPPESSERLNWVADHMYHYIKFRGYKTITRFFPHEIADLTIALDYMLLPNSPALVRWNWPLRYVTLLWLSLVCMIPFDLDQFDESDRAGETAEKIESLGKEYLDRAGLEREGAAILLARLYMRKDTSAKMPAFIAWSAEIARGPVEPFRTMGLLQVLCEVTKSGSVEQVKAHAQAMLDVANSVQQNSTLLQNTLIRKLRTKLISRVALRLLPASPLVTRSKGRALAASSDEEGQPTVDMDFDVPDELEGVLEDLLAALQDKDTVVRWSAAKGVARISERLPPDFARQVLDNVVNLFSIHSLAAATIYDIPSIAEGTWHGACLACAEMARRGLVEDDALADLIDWQCKAICFDIRKGAHSVGSNVRDAACYVLWSLARAQKPAVLAPFADNLSRRLVTVALFDREIHIRRAASATFQEFVGRTSLFAHGIDVLRKTDFYSVGIRRNAFLLAAPEVADLGPDSAARAARFLQGPDTIDIHGALAVLTELAASYRDSGHDLGRERRKVFAYLVQVPLSAVESPRHELITATACNLIANGISPAEISSDETSVPHWRKVVDIGLKSKSMAVQEAAAGAMTAVSKLVDCSAIVDRLIRDFSSGSPPMQQSLCRVLGALDYAAYPHGILKAIDCLLTCVDRSNPSKIVNVEARRNAFNSMPQILSSVVFKLTNHLSPAVVCLIIDAMLDGLSDYTSDERGDVGSWVRMACVKGLTSFAETLFPAAPNLDNFAEYLPSTKYHNAVGGILKQGVERLDNVRQLSGECFMRLLMLPLPAISEGARWQIHGHVLMKTLFLSSSGAETVNWNEGDKLFPKAVRLLEVDSYRREVLAGLVLSVSTKTDSTQRPVTASLIGYVHTLPVRATPPSGYDQCSLAQDLVAQASINLSSNNVIIPVLQTFNVLLESDVLEELSDDPTGLRRYPPGTAVDGHEKRGSPEELSARRDVHADVRILLLRVVPPCVLIEDQSRQPSVDAAVAGGVRGAPIELLGASVPQEHLYLVLQTKDVGCETDEAEEILLNTEWFVFLIRLNLQLA
ncbi:hypothetical protein EVJ58_g10139 [Rhodofomes roseus]|uniref:Uncharacterized protein n=1 Tax=Rhodofomes roseus TaxID=34475 RepID=A0A4Y9XQ33_9APHY|nr:hypothetical protein EVJ58_g10139 [Rhodofomes roseus]